MGQTYAPESLQSRPWFRCAIDYHNLNRLQKIYSRASATTPILSYYGYRYNDANQRTAVNLLDGSYWLYRYDSLGQVISGKKYWADGSPVPGQQYEYGFDDIGNRKYAQSGGDSTGASMRTANYNLNSANLNQYGNRSTPASIDIIGLGSPAATVTINSSPADYRRGEYFWENLGLTTGANPLWQSVSVDAGGTPVTGNLLIPPATQTFTYDLDGNLTSDGLWTYYYDAENRLYRIENPATLSPTTARKKLVFEYDHLGRRIRKQVFLWATSDYSGTATSDTKFFYDGWNLIKETTGTAWKAYMWGLDLSGTTEGAGGVGGLLLFNDSALGASFVSYDGNGNVVKLTKATASTPSAIYEYDPFGQMIRMSGSSAAANPMRFSSKYQDSETDLLYYGRRFLSPAVGRWVNRDPRQERRERNLFAFITNDLNNKVDPIGLCAYPETCGSDVTEWFGVELVIAMFTLDQVESRYGWADELKWITHHGLEIQYKSMAFRGQKCPTSEGCKNTVSVKDRCIDRSELGNIMFGFWVAYLHHTTGELWTGANWVNIKHPGEGPNDESDVSGIAIGYALGLYQNGLFRWPAGKTYTELSWPYTRDDVMSYFNSFWAEGWSDPWYYIGLEHEHCDKCDERYNGPHHPLISPKL